MSLPMYLQGPPLAWQVNGIGQGVGSVAVSAGRVYVLGTRGTHEHLSAVRAPGEAADVVRRQRPDRLQLTAAYVHQAEPTAERIGHQQLARLGEQEL